MTKHYSISYRVLAGCTALLLSTILWTGCASNTRDVPRYAWETAQEENYTEVFRGRWWNFYDRGMWNQLRGNYETAEKDLTMAISKRSRDQLWPRTYGVHFIPEYFPSRELGITYYQRGEFSEAVQFLEEGLDQQYSARGAFYVDLARREVLLADGSDLNPPDFQLISPALDSPTGAVYTKLEGIATDDRYVAKIFVNGESVDVRQSDASILFTHDIVFTPGTNTVEVEVVDLLGKSSKRTFEFNADHDGPVISFDEYDASGGSLVGVVFDNVEVASLQIDEQVVSLQPQSDGISGFNVAVSRASADRGVVYRCEDVNGNVTEGVVPSSILKGRLARKTDSRVQVALDADAAPGLLRTIAQDTSATSQFTAELINLEENQRYYLDVITVNMVVDSSELITQVTFNGRNIPVIPSRKYLRLSQKLALGDEASEILCRLEAINELAESASDEKRIRRELNDFESDLGRLSLAFGTPQGTHPNLTKEQIKLQFDQLQQNREFQKRFGQPVIRDQKILDRMLLEQELRPLSSDDGGVQGLQLVRADVLIEAKVVGGKNDIQIVLEGHSAITNRIITNRVEVAGPFDELPRLMDLLATRLIQEFPRLKAPVTRFKGPIVDFALTESDRIRQNYNCILVERVTTPHEVFGLLIEHESLGEGRITSVRAENYSKAEMTYVEGFSSDVELGPGYDTYFVVTK